MKKLTLGAKMFIIILFLIPILMIGILYFDFKIETNYVKKEKKNDSITFNELYKFVKSNKEWYPFTESLLNFYKYL